MTALLAILKAVPLWLWAVSAVILAIFVGLGVQTYRLDSLQVVHAEYVSQVAGEKLIAEAAARQEEKRRQSAIDEVRDDAQTQKALDDARAADLITDGDRLRKQVSSLLGDRTTLSARLASRGKTVGDLADLLAKLRDEADDYAGQLAVALTASRRAGFACEQSYDAMRHVK